MRCDDHRGDRQQARGQYPAAVGDLRQHCAQAAEHADQGEGAQAGLDVRLPFPLQADQQADADAGGKGLQNFVSIFRGEHGDSAKVAPQAHYRIGP
jgi:hypothetical protein